VKKATCRDLRGACDEVITGETPKLMAQNARNHIEDKLDDGDEAHKQVVKKIMNLSRKEQKKWYAEFVDSFEDFEEA